MSSFAQSPSNLVRARVGARVIAALFVGGGHLAIALFVMNNVVRSQTRSPAVEPIIVFVEPQRPVIDSLSLQSEQPASQLALVAPELPPQAMLVETAVDPPKVDPGFAPDMAFYSQRANLTHGTKASVMLLLDIAADGSVITAQLVRGSDDAAVNAVAIEYAKATRWIPGTVDGVPRTMQASLNVILGERG
jgi:TonB family protein